MTAYRIRREGLNPNIASSIERHFNNPLQLRVFTVATLPSAAVAGLLVYVSDESGGATIAFSDGSNWKRAWDLATVS